MTEEELVKRNKMIASITTAGIQVVLFLVLFLFVAWRPPDPPLPEYGVELNFGLDAQGYGDVQPEAPVGDNGDRQEESKPEAKQPEPQKEPLEEEPEINEIKQEVVSKPVETKVPDPELTSTEESPVVVIEKKEKPEEIKPVADKPIEKVEVKKTPEKVEEKKVAEKKVETKVQEAPKAVFKPKEQSTATATGDGDAEGKKEGKPGNHGDDPGTTGDKGSPQGKLDAKALYGQPGGGGGGISMSGFNGFDWPTVQAPTLPDEAFGVYEFMVKIDDQGDVISVTPLQRGLSLEAERKLKTVIQQLVFTPKGSNLPPQSEGKITFRVVSK